MHNKTLFGANRGNSERAEHKEALHGAVVVGTRDVMELTAFNRQQTTLHFPLE